MPARRSTTAARGTGVRSQVHPGGARTLLTGLLLLALVGVALVQSPPRADAACSGNAVACENQLAGTPGTEWDIFGSGDDTIQGFATASSINAGSRIDFKVDTDARAYTVKIYRLGWYQGNGAREIATVIPSAPLPQVQPACASDPATELYDCGTWDVSASWNVPATAVSGVYIARLVRTDTGGDSHMPFVVRNDGNTSKVVFQTSDTTWQAYNTYGGSDFYEGKANGRAYKISYNRPYLTRGTSSGRDFLFSNEYPMLRFLEQNGIDVSYVSGIDVGTDPALLVKHKAFISVGHDEYWSKEQRKNVTDARDAGVSLAFFGGNDVYWKTRLEPSQDGRSTPNRTLVDYKNTWANAPIDPVEPTATWRDPRFGDLGFGYGPENALIGTQYQANFDDMAMQVSSAEGKLRLWRGTSLATMANGATATLSDHTIGYESNEDVDNGYRPAGLIRASTTVGPTPEYLTDFGNTVVPSTTTHHVTLYRAASGALVFSAGTIQWAWGVDSAHDGTPTPSDPRMRQATLNVLTDMGAPATTLAPDLTAVTATADTTPPTVTVSAPAPNQSLSQGSLLTVSGTAADVGGRVGGVEVSVDGGASFHPAEGRESWTYTGVLTGNGAGAVQVRATDDSSRTSVPVKVAVTSTCPCTIFGVSVPKRPDAADGSAVTLGTKFTASADGYISGVRFYKSAANTGVHTGTLYSASGSPLATGTFANETSSGWQTLIFTRPVSITAGTTYVAAYYAPSGHYSADSYYFLTPHNAGILTASGGSGAGNGVFAERSAFPTSSFQSTNYYVDAVYSADDTTPATVTSLSPKAGSSSVATTSVARATFSKAVDPASIRMQVTDPDQNLIPGTLSYDAATKTATYNPAQGLANATVYTVTVNAATMSAPVQWTFTTVMPDGAPNECPCTLFDEADQPLSGPADDNGGVKLGMAFTADQAGAVTGVRFYKRAEDTAPHKVALWSGSVKVAETTTTDETTSGWQQADFASPASVKAGTSYVVSYTSTTGRYGFTSGGLTNPVTRTPLAAPAGAGRYTYDVNGAPSNTSNANYYVDPVFVPSAATPPVVASSSPGPGATSVPVAGHLQVTFNTEVQPGSATIALVRTSDGASVSGNTGSESQGATATFIPATDLDPGTRYTLSVRGAVSSGGAKMSGTYSTTFTTSGAAACPCSLMETTTKPVQADSGDTSAVTLGLKFSPTTTGFIKGLRYYRDAANTGTHTGALYAENGQKLASLTFTDSGTGWQTAYFAANVPVTAGSTYVASYLAPNGHYAADLNYFTQPAVNTPLTSVAPSSSYLYGDGFPDKTYANTNYYVDVVFDTNDDGAPVVTTVTPSESATDVPADTSVTATFGKAITPGSLVLQLADPAGQLVGGQLGYDETTRKATFTTAAPLLAGTVYSVQVDANSASGVAMTTPKKWSFTTADTQPPVVTAVAPADGATGVSTSARLTAVFERAVDPAGMSFLLTNQATGTVVPGTTTYDATSRTATFSPTAALADSTGYAASVTARSSSGVSMAAPRTWQFTTGDATAPSVTSTTPAASATGVAVTSAVTATLAGTTSYDPATRTATFRPTNALVSSTAHTVSVSARSATNVAMPTPATWSFTTAAQVFSLYSTATPSNLVTSTSTAATTVGVRFSSGRAGQVTAIRYYATTANAGSTVKLWNATTGAQLGTASTTATGTGWRTATFASPVAITAGTAYVASYRAPVGRVSSTTFGYLGSYTATPLSVPSLGGRSGVTDVMPGSTTSTNYWVDVLVRI